MSTQRKHRPARAAGAETLARTLDARLFKALGDPTRLHLLSCLAHCCKPCSVKAVAECCSVDYSVVSRHLAQLEEAGVLTSRRDGKSILYAVAYGPLSQALTRLAEAIADCEPGPKARSNCRGLCCCGPTKDNGGLCKPGCC